MSNLSILKTEMENSYKKAKEQNTKATNEYLKALNESYNKQLAAFQKQINEKKAAVPRNYTDDYDLNAINKLINERKLKERMASLGLTNSGVNQTLNAGLEVAKQNADNLVTIQKNKELNDLDNKYSEFLSSLNADLSDKKAAAQKSLNDKNASLLSTLTAKYNKAVEEANKPKTTTQTTTKTTTTKSSSNSNLISVYNKLISMNSPKQQMFYINMLNDDGILNSTQVKRLKQQLGLNNYY